MCNYHCGELDIAKAEQDTCDDIPQLCQKAFCCDACTEELQQSISCVLDACSDTDCNNIKDGPLMSSPVENIPSMITAGSASSANLFRPAVTVLLLTLQGLFMLVKILE